MDRRGTATSSPHSANSLLNSSAVDEYSFPPVVTHHWTSLFRKKHRGIPENLAQLFILTEPHENSAWVLGSQLRSMFTDQNRKSHLTICQKNKTFPNFDLIQQTLVAQCLRPRIPCVVTHYKRRATAVRQRPLPLVDGKERKIKLRLMGSEYTTSTGALQIRQDCIKIFLSFQSSNHVGIFSDADTNQSDSTVLSNTFESRSMLLIRTRSSQSRRRTCRAVGRAVSWSSAS